MAKEIQDKKGKAPVPDNAVGKIKKLKKAESDVVEAPAKKRKATDDAAPVAVKKSKNPTTLPTVAQKVSKTVDTADKAVENTNGTVPSEKVSKKSKAVTAVAKRAKNKDTTRTETKSASNKSKNSDSSDVDDEDDDKEEDVEDLSEDDNQTEAFLKGFASDEEESDAAPVKDVGEIPALNEKLKKQTRKAADSGANEKPGVVYIGRIPHGFYEHEMREYFKQFGTILNLRLSRNRKTGASKHIAWIKFESATVADIVARTMDNYLLFNHILKVKLLPYEQVPENLFKGSNRRFKKVPWSKIEGRKLKLAASHTTWDKRVEKEVKRREEKAEKLKEIGYEFDSPKIKSAKNIAKKKSAPLTMLMDIEVRNEDKTNTIESAKSPAAVESTKSKEEKMIKAQKVEEPKPLTKEVSGPDTEELAKSKKMRKDKKKGSA